MRCSLCNKRKKREPAAFNAPRVSTPRYRFCYQYSQTLGLCQWIVHRHKPQHCLYITNFAQYSMNMRGVSTMIVRNDTQNDTVLWDNGKERLYIFEIPPENCYIPDKPCITIGFGYENARYKYTCPQADMRGHDFKKFFENFIFYIFRIRNSAVRTVWSTLNSNCNEYGENDAPRRPVTSALPLVVILMSMYPSVSQPMS